MWAFTPPFSGCWVWVIASVAWPQPKQTASGCIWKRNASLKECDFHAEKWPSLLRNAHERARCLYDGAGWRLSPAYDLNPVPAHVKPRELSTAINLDEDTAASIELAVEVADEFFLARDAAKSIAAEVAESIADWRGTAVRVGLDRPAIDEMESAFEHTEARTARAWK